MQVLQKRFSARLIQKREVRPFSSGPEWVGRTGFCGKRNIASTIPATTKDSAVTSAIVPFIHARIQLLVTGLKNQDVLQSGHAPVVC